MIDLFLKKNYVYCKHIYIYFGSRFEIQNDKTNPAFESHVVIYCSNSGTFSIVHIV